MHYVVFGLDVSEQRESAIMFARTQYLCNCIVDEDDATLGVVND